MGTIDPNTPEFRNGIYNYLLSVMENGQALALTADTIDKMSFEDLTPELWAKVVATTENMRFCANLCVESVKESPMFMDDPKALQLIGEHVEERIRREE